MESEFQEQSRSKFGTNRFGFRFPGHFGLQVLTQPFEPRAFSTLFLGNPRCGRTPLSQEFPMCKKSLEKMRNGNFAKTCAVAYRFAPIHRKGNERGRNGKITCNGKSSSISLQFPTEFGSNSSRHKLTVTEISQSTKANRWKMPKDKSRNGDTPLVTVRVLCKDKHKH